MKTVFFIAVAFFMQTIAVAQEGNLNAKSMFAKIEWVVGNWNRTNVKAGHSATESWIKAGDYELNGRGTSMRETDTSFIEKLKILIRENELYYVADVPGNKQPVYFKMTSVTNDGFVCENPQHDFPKAISYQKEREGMKATISGNGKSIDYLFERKE